MGDTLVKKRVEWIDCAKGITMLLVILGHSVFGSLRGAIFSFHMPLFFILSCMTYRLSADGSQLWKKSKKAFVHLVLPALILFLLDNGVKILLTALEGGFRPTLDFWKTKALTLLFASGSAVDARFPIDSVPIERMGIPWFLIVLFTGRTLLDLMHLKMGRSFVPACVLLSIAGVVIGQYVWLPLSFDVTLASLLFLLLGYGFRGYDMGKRPVVRFLTASVLWLGTMLVMELADDGTAIRNYMEMSTRRYPLYPLCLVAAVSGTMMVAYISSFLVRYLGWLKRPLMFIGEHSLMLLCVHTMDYLWEDVYTGASSEPLFQAAVRIVADLAVFVIVVYIKKLIGKWRCKNEV